MSSKRRALVGLASAAVLTASVLGGWLVHRASAAPRMMQVGGHMNPCTCTHRIEP